MFRASRFLKASVLTLIEPDRGVFAAVGRNVLNYALVVLGCCSLKFLRLMFDSGF